MHMKYLPILFIPFFITGCGTTIFPEANGTYHSVSSSSSEAYAQSNALKDAEAHCKKMGKSLQVLKHNHSYHGATTENKIAGTIVSAFVGINPAISEDDNKVELHFRCR